MTILARLTLLIPALPSVAACLLSTTVAVAEDTRSAAPAAVAEASAPTDRKKRCKLLQATRGESAELVPEEQRTPSRAAIFPYAFDDSGLQEDFRINDKRRRGCMAVFGIQQAASAGSASGAAGTAGPAAGVATGAGFGAAGAISAGTIALGGLGFIAAATAVGVATAGGTGAGPGAPTNTTLGGGP